MSRLITREEVKKHSSNQSVWMVIHNEVYDVTKFLDEHPGGADSLMDFAGQDGTQGFEDVGHSDDAREMMKQYKIGNLPPGEQTQSSIVSCCKKKKSSANASRTNDCIVCHQASSCPSVPKGGRKEKSWRTFDGSPDRTPKSPKTEYKSPAAPRTEPRIQTIVVPRERRPRGPPCESTPKSPKTEYKSPAAPRTEPRIQTIVVPRERRPRGPPCERLPPGSHSGSSNLKWALLALGTAIVIGVVMKKYMT